MSAWPIVPIKDYARVVGGATPKSEVAEYWGGEVFWATPKDLSGLREKNISSTPRKITISGLNSCAAEVLPPNSVLFSSRAPIGHVAINSVPMATNQGFKSFIPSPDLDASFLYWWLKCHRAQLELLGNGATFKEVSKAIVERIEIPLPPLDEQKRIAKILDKADEIRRKRQQALDRLNQLGQAIFYEMFGDPATNPMQWSVVKLCDIVRVGDKINYGVVQPGDDVKNGVPLVRVGDLLSGHINPENIKKIDVSIEANYKRSRLQGDEILIGCVGSIGVVAFAHMGLKGANIARAVARVPIDSSVAVREFVAEQIKSTAIQSYFKSKTRIVAQPTLNIGLISETLIMLPPYECQLKFLRKYSQVLRNIIHYTEYHSRQAALYSSLQHRAFSGML